MIPTRFELIEKLHAYPAGDPFEHANFDDWVLYNLGFREKHFPMDSCPYWAKPGANGVLPSMAEKPTRSVDAALFVLGAVLPGWEPVMTPQTTGKWTVSLKPPNRYSKTDLSSANEAKHASLPIAMVISALGMLEWLDGRKIDG